MVTNNNAVQLGLSAQFPTSTVPGLATGVGTDAQLISNDKPSRSTQLTGITQDDHDSLRPNAVIPGDVHEGTCAIHSVDVLVIGAGQAGLCVAYELQKRGFTGFAEALGADDGVTKWRKKPALGTFVVIDADWAPGGAWQHKWESLTMEHVHGILELPKLEPSEIDPRMPAKKFVSSYFAEFEHEHDLPILRPVKALAVRRTRSSLWPDHRSATQTDAQSTSRTDTQSSGQADMWFEACSANRADACSDFGGARSDTQLGEYPFLIETDAGAWKAKFVVNCTGTWTRPYVPYCPGRDSFRGKQFHTQTYPGPERFWKQRVLVVGGGHSARRHVQELAAEAKKVRWVAPELAAGSDSDGKSRELVPSAMCTRIDSTGAWFGAKHEKFDAIIWATGFRPNLGHLRPLGLKAMPDPCVYVLGYGSSGSTKGARLEAREIARDIRHRFTEFR